MARAILNDDCIVKITVDPNLGREVGLIPKGVGFERLRWNGFEMIDLIDLDEYYVSRNTFKLHIKPASNRDLVKMQYQDRKYLFFDGHKIRLKTQDEINKPKRDEYIARRRKEYPSISDQVALIMDYLKTKPGIGKELEQTINKIEVIKNRWPKTS